LEKIRSLIKENKALLSFLGWAFLLLLLWVVLETFFHEQVMEVHSVLIVEQTKISGFILRLLGYSVHTEYGIPGHMSKITLEDTASVYIGSGCSGLELFLIFAGFIIIFKGAIRHKIWFVPLGLLLVLILNIIRIIALIILVYKAPEYMDFNHKYTFVFIVYGAIFLLWIWWVNRFSNMKSK